MFKITISKGRSEVDRIMFADSSNNTGTAIRKANGEIETEYKSAEQIRKELKKELITSKMILATIFNIFWLFGLPIIKGYFINPMIKNNSINIAFYLISTVFLITLTFIGVISLYKQGSEIRKNHGAEHKVYAAYKKLGYIPTVQKAQCFSRICNVCGATIYSALITGQLIGFIVYICTGFMIPEKLLFLVPFLLHSIFPFNFLGKLVQFITTKEPDDSNIELAISAIRTLQYKGNETCNYGETDIQSDITKFNPLAYTIHNSNLYKDHDVHTHY